MRYRFLDERTGLLQVSNSGGVILSYIYRDVDTLLADGFEYCMLVTDRRRVQGKTYNQIYRLYWICADECTAIYALLDNSIRVPIITLNAGLWYTCCNAADIVTSVIKDKQLIRYYRDTVKHTQETFYKWCVSNRCYWLHENIKFLTCDNITVPIYVPAHICLTVNSIKDDRVTFVYEKTKFVCDIPALPCMRLQRFFERSFFDEYNS